jgi:putative LysE/RhtB family amino acid efflux pump
LSTTVAVGSYGADDSCSSGQIELAEPIDWARFAGMRSLAVGFGLGFFVALQLGPMSLFLIRSTLRSGAVTGLAIGLGIASVDGLYAALGAMGAASLLAIDPLRWALGIVGAGTLALIGLRTVALGFRVRTGLEAQDDLTTPRRAFLSSLAGTASNPSTVASWAAIFTAATVGTGSSAVPLVFGVAAGSLTWVTILAIAVSVLRRAAGPRTIRAADTLAGAGLLGFAGILAYRTVHTGG